MGKNTTCRSIPKRKHKYTLAAIKHRVCAGSCLLGSLPLLFAFPLAGRRDDMVLSGRAFLFFVYNVQLLEPPTKFRFQNTRNVCNTIIRYAFTSKQLYSFVHIM
ncbi:hypothetical protein V6N13_025866 [Hibiscus sabdariffa]|uniref:Uncharacterized protein n=2 Tax=Hibiscus sabdariffa TaxID=183260 RepID=A0ABR2NFA6_9ROSI